MCAALMERIALTPSDTAEHLERLTDLMLALGIDVVLRLNTKAGHLLWNK